MSADPQPQDISESPSLPLPNLADASLFLDFDGTLVDIAPRPDAIAVPASLKDLLANLGDQTNGRIALVSGRAIADIQSILPYYDGILAGGHGAELFQNGEIERVTGQIEAALTNTISALERFADSLPGILCEPKATGVVLHYRGRPEAEAAVREAAAMALSSLPDFELHDAKMAVELKHREASKGAAVAKLMAQFSAGTPVAIGDDTTDEDMFKVALAQGGTAIKVGDGPTMAPFRCQNPAAVHEMLARWQRQSC
ncbi:MAG: trehalose-phosphatase [Alphaproteobacteria bacterium]|nr:trehalose-phosphatase [Alphaproteobacteria bacterium SS10]